MIWRMWSRLYGYDSTSLFATVGFPCDLGYIGSVSVLLVRFLVVPATGDVRYVLSRDAVCSTFPHGHLLQGSEKP